MAKTNKNNKSLSFLIVITAVAFLFILLYFLNRSGMIFNFDSDAGANRYTANGTLILSSYNSECDRQYQYGLIGEISGVCTSLVISQNKAERYLGENVTLRGALKDGVFYVTSVTKMGNGTGNIYPTEFPVALPDSVHGLPKSTPDIPPPGYDI